MAEAAPAFEFDGQWPLSGTVRVNGHQMATVTSWAVQAGADGIPLVTLSLLGPDALRLVLGGGARVQVADESAAALESLGWKPPTRS